MSKPRPIEMATDADLRGSWPALQRAAVRAHALAAKTGTAVVVTRNCVLEHVYPQPEAAPAPPVYLPESPQRPSTAAMTTEPWVSVEQVAQHLGVAKDTVYRWREHRGLPAHRVGRLWKFKLSGVDEWVRAGGADEGKDQQSGGAA